MLAFDLMVVFIWALDTCNYARTVLLCKDYYTVAMAMGDINKSIIRLQKQGKLSLLYMDCKKQWKTAEAVVSHCKNAKKGLEAVCPPVSIFLLI